LIPAVRKPSDRWLPLTTLVALAALVAFQAWVYSTRLQLSLGPRVILQPWLLHRGFLMYENAADLHTPLMPLILSALVPLIPDGLERAKLALVGLLSLTTLLVFAASLRRAGWWIGLLGAAFFVLWSPAFGYGKLWYESFLAPIYVLWLITDDPSATRPSAKSLLFLGFLGGVGVLLKQHAALVFAAFVSWNIVMRWCTHHSLTRVLREAAWVGVTTLLTIGSCLAYQFMRAGTLQGLIYWIFTYPLAGVYASLAAKAPGPSQVRLLAISSLVLPLSVASLIYAARKKDKDWLRLGGALVLLSASSITAFPRFEMFHLQGTLAILAIVSCLTVSYILRSWPAGRLTTTSLVMVLSALWLVTPGRAYRDAIQRQTPRQIAEYSALVPLADEIRQVVGPSACVYVFPESESNSNLYYLLGCSPPRYWVFHYPWYMIEPIKSWALHALQEASPEWVIYFPGDWRQAQELAPEFVEYIRRHYQEGETLSEGQLLLHQMAP